jgi:hypothetical protein
LDGTKVVPPLSPEAWVPHHSGSGSNYFLRYDDLDFSIDMSRMKFPDDFFGKMRQSRECAEAPDEQ